MNGLVFLRILWRPRRAVGIPGPMPLSLTELFRVLAAFDPPRTALRDAPWDEYVDWAIAQGLGPLAAYNLEYRLPGSGAPDWVRDRLLSIFQGSANDNVMKLMGFKRAVGELEGRRLVLLGGASFAEALYPHVAFRPVIDLSLFLPRGDVDPFVGWLRRVEFRSGEGLEARPGARVLTDGRTLLHLYGELVGDAAEDEGLLMRALPVKVFGPSVRRLGPEDALVVHALLIARAGFDVPMLEFIDLRELVLGAPSVVGPYSQPPDPSAVQARAKAWKAERALWAALSVVGRLFPETTRAVAGLLPPVSLPLRELLDRLLVSRVAEVGRVGAFRGEDALRHALSGA